MILHTSDKIKVNLNKVVISGERVEMVRVDQVKETEKSAIVPGLVDTSYTVYDVDPRTNRTVTGPFKRVGVRRPILTAVPDERFNDLITLERKYRNQIKVKWQQWKEVEEELYPLIMTLLEEHRIEGKFDLPLQDLVKFKELEAKLKRLQEQVDNLDLNSQNPTRGRGAQSE